MEEKEYAIDLFEIAKILKENRKPIVRLTGCAIALGCVFLLVAWYLFPTYESEALLQIRQKNRGGGLASLMAGMGSADFLTVDSSSMDSYIEILKSRGVVIPVIEATSEQNFFGKYPDYKKYVEKRIKVEIAQGSGGGGFSSTNLLNVAVKAKTPEQAQHINQLLLEGFLKRVKELNSAEKGSIKVFLTDRLHTAKEELYKAETALQKFKEENRILSPSANAEIFTDRIMEAEKQAAANQIELEAAQARLARINEQLNNGGAANADNVTLQHYNKELAELETTRIAYRDKYTEEHPRMIEIKERIAKLKDKIQAEINKVAALQAPSDNAVHQSLVGGKYSAEGAVTVARQKAAALQKLIEQNNAELAKMPAIEQQYIRLSRDYAVANEIHMLLTKQLEQTKITEKQEPTNVLIVDPPHLADKPIFPQRGITLLTFALLGFLGSSFYVICKEWRKHTIKTAEMISDYVDLPVFGVALDEGTLKKDANLTLEGLNTRDDFLSKVKVAIWKK